MVKRYQKGSGKYTCYVCKKETRETGEGESQHKLCRKCYEIAGYENMHSDDGHEGDLWECEECLGQMDDDLIAHLPTNYPDVKLVKMGNVWAAIDEPTQADHQAKQADLYNKIARHCEDTPALGGVSYKQIKLLAEFVAKELTNGSKPGGDRRNNAE